MATSAVFPEASARARMYESFFLRAVAPEEPVGVWIRYTVHKRRGERATGALWCTVFDSRRGRPFMSRISSQRLAVVPGGWIEVGDARMTPAEAVGSCGGAEWSLRFTSDQPELLHLPLRWLYSAPLPRTKLSSPLPAARFDGTVQLPGEGAIELRGWRGTIGHNWGSEHAERWIWLAGLDFAGEREAWLDVALGRVRVGGRSTPWLANGALSLDGHRLRIGGLSASRPRVAERSAGCELALAGERGLAVRASVDIPEDAGAHWHYSDPAEEEGSEVGGRDVMNCSVAALELVVRCPGHRTSRTLRTAHGGAYELGTRERA